MFLNLADINHEDPNAFFLSTDTSKLPIPDNNDKAFKMAGWLRSPMISRNKSSQIPFESLKNLVFKLRTLFGITPRAEILAYLIGNEKATAPEIIDSTGYSKPTVYDTLSDLVAGKHIDKYNINGLMNFSIDLPKWKNFLNIKEVSPKWISWQRIFVALYQFSCFLIEYTNLNISDYLIKSKLITMYEILSNAFAGSGIQNPFKEKVNLKNAFDIFPEDPIRA